MAVPSKLYQAPLNKIHCSQVLLHPQRTCLQFLISNSYMHTLSTLKYFLPMLITPIFLKIKKLDRKSLLNIIKQYLECSVWSAAASTIVFSSICLLRCYNGDFKKYTVTFLPTFIGTQLCWFFPERVSMLFTTATSQASLEALLRLHAVTNPVSNTILNSKLIQTFVFMLNSAIILHNKRAKRYNGFWFIQSLQQQQHTATTVNVESNNENNNNHNTELEADIVECEKQVEGSEVSLNACTHMHSCTRFILEGMKSYLSYGIPLDLLNMIMKGQVAKTSSRSTWHICLDKLKGFRPTMTAFFLSYVGIYRLSSCVMNNYCSQNASATVRHVISAFLGGASYIFMDKITFVTLSLVLSTQIIWQHFCERTQKAKKPNVLCDMLRRIEFGRIVTPLNMGLLVHCFVFQHFALNSLGRGFVNAISNKTSQRVYDMLMRYDLDYLLQRMYEQPRKGLW